MCVGGGGAAEKRQEQRRPTGTLLSVWVVRSPLHLAGDAGQHGEVEVSETTQQMSTYTPLSVRAVRWNCVLCGCSKPSSSMQLVVTSARSRSSSIERTSGFFCIPCKTPKTSRVLKEEDAEDR